MDDQSPTRVTLARRVALPLAGAVIALILVLTLRTGSDVNVHGLQRCVVCGTFGATDFALNVLMYVPLGVLLALGGARWWLVILLPLALATAIETAQLYAIVGRVASIGDVVSNVAGAWIGSFGTLGWIAAEDRRRLARSAGLLAAAVWVGVSIFAALAFQRSIPVNPYWVQLRPPVWEVPFGGRVSRATLGGAPLRNGLGDEENIRRLLGGGAAFAVTAWPPHRVPKAEAAIAALVTGDRRLVTRIGTQGTDVIFFQRLRAADWQWRTPMLRLRNAIPIGTSESEPIQLAGRSGSDWTEVFVQADARRETRVHWSPQLWWTVLWPGDLALDDRANLYAAIEAALAAAVITVLLARGGLGARAPLLAGCAAVICLAVVPMAASHPIGSPTEWLGAALGIVTGALLRLRLRKAPDALDQGVVATTVRIAEPR